MEGGCGAGVDGGEREKGERRREKDAARLAAGGEGRAMRMEGSCGGKR
jgi:hypothetical protein